MMFNAKLMLLVVMLWTGSLTLASSRHQSNMMRKIRTHPVCDKYELPENAVWISRANCEDNTQFQCQPGYQSRVQTTCNKNGKWNLEPSCKAVECPSGEEIENSGTVTPSDVNGADFNFDCMTGFTKNGLEGTLECGESGNWIVTTPCEAVECPSGEEIENSDTVTPSDVNGADFSFDCLTGFTKNGLEGTLECGESGIWIVTTPCEGCDYKYSYDTFVNTEYGTILNSPQSMSLAACNDVCDNDDKCTFALHVEPSCYIYESPVIFASFSTDSDQCIQQCTDSSDCLTMVNMPRVNYCYLYNITLEEIPDGQKNSGPGAEFTVAEKC